MERFYVEWNAGGGWVTNSAHTFWTQAAAVACREGRMGCEKLSRWPMRLVRRGDPVTGETTELAI